MRRLPLAMTLVLLVPACGGDAATAPSPDGVSDGASDSAAADAVEPDATSSLDAVDSIGANDAIDSIGADDASAPAPIALAPGALDPGYGDAGVVRVPTSWSPFGVLALPDGGALIYGYPREDLPGPLMHGTVLRLTVHGDLDTSFGVDGAVSLPPNATPLSALLLPNGSIALAGFYVELPPRPGLWRLRSDGAFDPDFGAAGVVRLAVGTAALALAAGPGGALRVLGVHGFDGKALTIHLLADGTPDPAFGDAGVVTVDVAAAPVHGVCAPGDDGGFALTVDRRGIASLVHILSSGALDTSFGRSGYLDLAASETVRDAAGRFIYAARNAAPRAPHELAFTALTGTTAGLMPRRPGGGAVFAWGARADGQSGIVAAAIHADGSNDLDFGTDGTFDLWRDLGIEASQGVGVVTLDATGNATFAARSNEGDLIVLRLGP